MVQGLRGFRGNLRDMFASKGMQGIIAALLVVSAVTISWEITIRFDTTEEAKRLTSHLSQINTSFLYIFVAEILLRFFAYGRRYFKSSWNIFDFVVIGLAVATLGSFFQILRTFRLFLFFKNFSIFPNLQYLVAALEHAIPKLFSTAVLLILAVYIFAIWGVLDYSERFPTWFGTLPTAFSTIFNAVLIENSWSEIYKAMVKVEPYTQFYIYPAVIVLKFLILQLVLGVIINALYIQTVADRDHKKHSFILGWITGKYTKHHASPLSADTKIILHELGRLSASLTPTPQKPEGLTPPKVGLSKHTGLRI
jgi:voltage-gated sodium channel